MEDVLQPLPLPHLHGDNEIYEFLESHQKSSEHVKSFTPKEESHAILIE